MTRGCLLAFAAALYCASAAAQFGNTPSTIRIPIGDVQVEVEDEEHDDKVGSAFVPVLTRGAHACYVEVLRSDPSQKGELAYEVRPPRTPPGKYLVTVERRGAIGEWLAGCVERAFEGLFYSDGRAGFDKVVGTFRFEPRWILAPARPTTEEALAAFMRKYSPPDIVRLDRVGLKSVEERVDPENSAVYRIYFYDVEVVFVSNGYEAQCKHYGPYTVFSQLEYEPAFAGHTCVNFWRVPDDRAPDKMMVIFELSYSPKVATSWVVE